MAAHGTETQEESARVITAIIIGAGNRGFIFGHYARTFPEQIKIVGAAEPRRCFLDKMAILHNIAPFRLYTSWICAADQEKFADAVIICTMDHLHKEPTIAFAKKGYHIFVEKPMALNYSDCKLVAETIKETGVIYCVCMVLRYDKHAAKMLQLIKAETIGEIVNIQHTDPIGYYHFAHSYVRGKWSSRSSCGSLLLSKCVHDFDFIGALLATNKCKSVSSFGSLKHFNKANKPKNAGPICIGCCVEPTCPFAATRIYLKPAIEGHLDWPVSVLTDFPDVESVTDALIKGAYGKCVYDTLNDVIDHQVVNMMFDNDATVSLTTGAFTEKMAVRRTVVNGTRGEMTCNFDEPHVTVFDFLTNTKMIHNVHNECNPFGETGSARDADYACFASFIRAIQQNRPEFVKTDAEESLKAHLLVFAANKALQTNKIVNPRKDSDSIK